MNAEKSPVNHNVDHEEIAKFEAVASRWWDLEGEFKPLHRINPLRLGYIAERAGGLFGKKVLDVGCGGGILAESMAREGATVTGLDMGFEQMIAQNRIWVMTKIKYVVYKQVDPGESYHLGTYPRPKKAVTFYRGLLSVG